MRKKCSRGYWKLKNIMNNSEVETYYTIIEVAKMLKVAYLTVYRWIQSGKLVALKAGKQYRIRKEDLDTFLKAKKS